jgi:hypothetical protein
MNHLEEEGLCAGPVHACCHTPPTENVVEHDHVTLGQLKPYRPAIKSERHQF